MDEDSQSILGIIKDTSTSHSLLSSKYFITIYCSSNLWKSLLLQPCISIHTTSILRMTNNRLCHSWSQLTFDDIVLLYAYTAPSVSDKQPLCQMGPRFSGIKRTRGSFLKQTPSTVMRRNSSLTPKTASTTATPTPVGTSTGRGFVFQKGVAKPPSSAGSNPVSIFQVMNKVFAPPPPPKEKIISRALERGNDTAPHACLSWLIRVHG